MEEEKVWDGHDRRGVTYDNDWHAHKLKILGDLKDVKEEVSKVVGTVNDLKIALATLQTKIMTTTGLVASGVTLVVAPVIVYIVTKAIG